MPIEVLTLLGAGGHAKVVLDAILLEHPSLILHIRDDDPKLRGQALLGRPIAGPIGEIASISTPVHVAIGANRVRKRFGMAAVAAGKELHTVIHQQAMVSKHASVAD